MRSWLRSIWLQLRIAVDSLYLRFFVRPRQRPASINIPARFADFVEKYGGEVCDRTSRPEALGKQVADYVFIKDNVIAELKCLETDPLSSSDEVIRLIEEFKKAGMSGHDIFRWTLGQQGLSENAVLRLAVMFRRRIEKIARKAEKQIESTRKIYNIREAKGLLLIANDKNYLFSYRQKLGLIAQTFARHFEESPIKGFVFFTPNVPMRIPGSLREWHPWSPSYSSGADDEFVSFVNDLGHHWGEYFFKLSGDDSPDIKIDDFEVAARFMKDGRNVDVRNS